MKIAIVTVAYNRPDCLRRLLNSLEQADYDEPVTLIVSVDKSKSDAVEQLAGNYRWQHGDKLVVTHKENLGLRRHMLSLGEHFKDFDALVVLEDDITVCSSFYHYVKACVERYYGDSRIAGISLYNFAANNFNFLPFTPAKSEYDVFLMNIAMSWGQVWMKPQWESFMTWYATHDEEFCLEHLPRSINRWPKSSWLKYHIRYCIEENKYFVYPYYSLSTNNTAPGENFSQSYTMFQTNMPLSLITDFRLPAPDEVEIRYDGFYQPKYIGKYLGIDEDELCVDLFSDKPACLYRRFLLTNKTLPYKVLKSYALQLRPLEMNVICQREGNELWLYDATLPSKPPKAPDRYLAYSYFYQMGFFKARTMIGSRRILSIITDTILAKAKLLKR